jgi:hypothetical protein
MPAVDRSTAVHILAVGRNTAVHIPAVAVKVQTRDGTVLMNGERCVWSGCQACRIDYMSIQEIIHRLWPAGETLVRRIIDCSTGTINPGLIAGR